MSKKMYEVEVTEAEKAEQRGREAAMAEVDKEAAVAVALAEFGAACEAVIAKRRKVYERFRELDEKMKGPGLERITMPEADPFDLDALKKAAMETGSPQEGKEWVAAVRALASSAYRDTEFFGACLVVLSECGGYLRQKDAELAETLADLEAERDRIVAEYNRKVAAARAELAAHRDRVHREIVAKATEADVSFTDDIPACFAGDKAARTIGLVYGPDIPVEAQLRSFFENAKIRSRPGSAGDPYAHLKNLPGVYVPGVGVGVSAVAQTPSGVVSSEGKRSFFDRFRRGKR